MVRKIIKKKNETSNIIDNKLIKNKRNNNLKQLTNNNFRKINNKSFITNEGKINMRSSKSKKVVEKSDKSPLSNKIKKYRINKNILNKEASKSVQKNIKKDREDKNNNRVQNKVIKIDLTNTLELNNIINNYLDKGENLRESKNLENIKEFANNLNNYFSNNIISKNNNSKTNENGLPLVLTNKDNNIEQNTDAKEHNNMKIGSSNKKEHENILNYDCERITTNKMGINSYDELIKDFSGSRGPTVANKINNNSSSDNKKSISPFEYQIIRNSNNNNEHNNNDIVRRESEFHIFDNNNNICNNLNNKDNNLCESDDELNNANINNEENDNSDKDNSGEEKVSAIMNCDCENKNSLNNNMDEKERIMEDKKLLTDRLESIKKEMLNLIGENDYKYVMELYSIIDKTKIDEIYVKIEEYVQKYDEDKKDKFDILYFKLISTDCQVQQKNNELQKLFFNDF